MDDAYLALAIALLCFRLQDDKICGVTLTQADAQTFSVLHTEYMVEVQSPKKCSSGHVGIFADLHTALSASCYVVLTV